jgi:ubiquinone/menaquinone biosynthesis C-methylase UbiE
MKKRRVIVSALVAFAVAAGIVCAQDNAADAKRLIEALQLRPGSVVAEIGAGGGELTIALARHVAPDGKILTTELGENRVQQLRSAVEKSGVSNVQVIEGHETRANLPEGCCDAIFMRSVYHHFGDPPAMNASFFQALKPGGRIAVIDFAPPKDTAAPGKRGENGAHGVSADVVAGELKAAGFEVISTEQGQGRNRMIMVVAARPEK